MVEILVEKPLTIALAGGLLFAIALMTGLRTGKRSIFVAAAAIAVIAGLLIFVERMIRTPREQLRSTLKEIAAAVDDRDEEKLLTYVHSSADHIREKVHRHYNTYGPVSASITRFDSIKVIGPDEGEVRFNVRVELPDQTAFAFVIANLKKEGGRWKVANYSAHPPQEGIMSDRRQDELPQYEY